MGGWGDGGVKERLASAATSCQPLASDASMLMQYVPPGRFCRARSPADRRNERFTPDTLGQTFCSRQTRLMVSQKP